MPRAIPNVGIICSQSRIEPFKLLCLANPDIDPRRCKKPDECTNDPYDLHTTKKERSLVFPLRRRQMITITLSARPAQISYNAEEEEGKQEESILHGYEVEAIV